MRALILTILAIIIILILAVVLLPGLNAPPAQPQQGELGSTSSPVPITETPQPILPTHTPSVQPTPTPAVLIGAGDISACGMDGDNLTARLIKQLLGKYPQAQIFTAGDNTQSNGQMQEYTDCFGPTWGKFKDRIHPSPGNHDWITNEGANYFAYFGAAAGETGKGYYSYNLGAWHIVSLNSNCWSMDCGENSPQAKWLRDDLEKNSSLCTLLYWHHPLRDSGAKPIQLYGETFWHIASEYGADVVVNGHDHHYERLTPLDRNGYIDLAHGIRTFIVGTGGAWLFQLGKSLPITEARDNNTYGVIVFWLYPDHYEWEFMPVYGGTYKDMGSVMCH